MRIGPLKRTPTPVLRIGKDQLSFTVNSSSPGYVYVLVLGPDGSLMLLFPNKRATSSRIEADIPLTLPDKSWPIKATEPAGIETFLVLVSERPRDFGAALKPSDDNFQELETGEGAAMLARALPSGQSIYAGRPDCSGLAGCADRYGATSFKVEVTR